MMTGRTVRHRFVPDGAGFVLVDHEIDRLILIDRVRSTASNRGLPMSDSTQQNRNSSCHHPICSRRLRSDWVGRFAACDEFHAARISVALAQKIAVNARKRPPIDAPNVELISPVNAVAAPPNAKRTRYSYHRPSESDDVESWICIAIPE